MHVPDHRAAPTPPPRSPGRTNMVCRYAVAPGRVMPAIQVERSGGSTWISADRAGRPARPARPSRAVGQRGPRLGADQRLGGRARDRPAEVRVVPDHAHLELGHDVEVIWAGRADDQAGAVRACARCVGPAGSWGPGARSRSWACSPCRSRASTPVTSRAGQLTIAAVSAARASGRRGQVLAPLGQQFVSGRVCPARAAARSGRTWSPRPRSGPACRPGRAGGGRRPSPAGRPFGPRASSGAMQPSGRSAGLGQQRVQIPPAPGHRLVDVVDRVPDQPGHLSRLRGRAILRFFVRHALYRPGFSAGVIPLRAR